MSDSQRGSASPASTSLGSTPAFVAGFLCVVLGAAVLSLPNGGLSTGLGFLAFGTSSLIVGGVLNAAEHICRATRETRSEG